jgi:hypothetical protein
MLTLDDLDHFSDPSMARLFAPTPRQADADTVARLTRIVACLNFCSAVPNEELAEGGLQAARRALKSVLRGEQRNRRLRPEDLVEALEGALLALGARAQRRGEPADAASERHAVESEIQTAAGKLVDEETLDPQLMESLACGDFEILPSSDFAPLAATLGKFAGAATIDVDLAVDSADGAQLVRVRLEVESGFWRWTAKDGCCLSRNGNPAILLPTDDAVVRTLLSGLALRNGRSIVAWAEAACAPAEMTAEAQPA